MSWFRKKPPPEIPPHVTQPCVIVRNEPRPKEEGIVVEENLDPSDSMIIRIVKAIKERV